MKTLIEIINDQAETRRWLYEQCLGLPANVITVLNRTEFVTHETALEGQCIYSENEHALYVYHDTQWEEINLDVSKF